MARTLAAALAALALAVCGPLPAALADGDPASDFLLSQSTFLSPFDGHIAPAESARLVELLTDAAKKGFPLKVAVIVTPYDLGSVPILFDKPKTYAKFLGEEDFYYWKNELLVVMPNGYGIYKATGVPAPDRALVDALKAPGTKDGTALVLSAERVVRSLAARHGITLPAVTGVSGSGSGLAWWEWLAAAIAAGALVAAALPIGRRRCRAR